MVRKGDLKQSLFLPAVSTDRAQAPSRKDFRGQERLKVPQLCWRGVGVGVPASVDLRHQKQRNKQTHQKTTYLEAHGLAGGEPQVAQ